MAIELPKWEEKKRIMAMKLQKIGERERERERERVVRIKKIFGRVNHLNTSS